MSSNKYEGQVGSASAMSALDPNFRAAYAKAADALMNAVLEFEKTTGRIVNTIELSSIDVTTCGDDVQKTIRHASLHFLPTPGEVAW